MRDLRHPDEVQALVAAGELSPAEALDWIARWDRITVSARPSARDGMVEGKSVARSDRPPSLTRFDGAELPAPDPEAEARRRVEEALAELDALVGLASVKRMVREVHALAVMQRRRQAYGLVSEATTLHMIFRGNPGTGKTTVARIVGRILREVGLLSRGHVVEVERADLVGEYIGHTAQRTREVIRRAVGGVLFVDEAYSLARGGEKDFGREAIDTLVKAMEDHKHELVVILAGYLDEMAWFLDTNPGLSSRFPIQIEFPDYSAAELLVIAEQMLARRQYRLAPGAASVLELLLGDGADRTSSTARFDGPAEGASGNARDVRNLIEQAIRRQALRLVGRSRVSRSELETITAEDLCEHPLAPHGRPDSMAPVAPRCRPDSMGPVAAHSTGPVRGGATPLG